MFKEEWWTEEEVCTDENGYVQVEGFKGEYLLMNESQQAQLQLTASETEEVCLITLE